MIIWLGFLTLAVALLGVAFWWIGSQLVNAEQRAEQRFQHTVRLYEKTNNRLSDHISSRLHTG